MKKLVVLVLCLTVAIVSLSAIPASAATKKTQVAFLVIGNEYGTTDYLAGLVTCKSVASRVIWMRAVIKLQEGNPGHWQYMSGTFRKTAGFTSVRPAGTKVLHLKDNLKESPFRYVRAIGRCDYKTSQNGSIIEGTPRYSRPFEEV